MAIQYVKSPLYAKALLRTSRPYAHLTCQAALAMLRASHRGTGRVQAEYQKTQKQYQKMSLQFVVTPDCSELSHEFSERHASLPMTSQLPSSNELIELSMDINISNDKALHGLVLDVRSIVNDGLSGERLKLFGS